MSDGISAGADLTARGQSGGAGAAQIYDPHPTLAHAPPPFLPLTASRRRPMIFDATHTRAHFSPTGNTQARNPNLCLQGPKLSLNTTTIV